MKRFPFWPTALVGVAVVAMVALGIWQLRRADEKQALLARYAAAGRLPEMAFPALATDDGSLFRRAKGLCLEATTPRVEAGRNTAGESGWRHIFFCRTGAEGPGMLVDAGWSRDFRAEPQWTGGQVSGVISQEPDHRSIIARGLGDTTPLRLMLVADVPAPGLEPSAKPKLEDVPNNHLAYAVQWFVFAGVAGLIYAIALRRRLKSGQTSQP